MLSPTWTIFLDYKGAIIQKIFKNMTLNNLPLPWVFIRVLQCSTAILYGKNKYPSHSQIASLFLYTSLGLFFILIILVTPFTSTLVNNICYDTRHFKNSKPSSLFTSSTSCMAITNILLETYCLILNMTACCLNLNFENEVQKNILFSIGVLMSLFLSPCPDW